MIIQLTQGKVALIDDEDAELVGRYKWHAVRGKTRGVGTVYWYAYTSRGSLGMHRLILGAPPHREVDHINGDGLDNRRANLRLATKSEQARNSIKKGAGARSSRYKGVFVQTWLRKDGGVSRYWRVQIELPGRVRISRRADTEEQAARIYNQLAREHFGPFARLNAI